MLAYRFLTLAALCLLIHAIGFRRVPCNRSLLKMSPTVGVGSRSETLLNANHAHAGYCAMLVVPTGIGAKIGGYAGDALPAARLLSSIVDTLITHPNVMNGAMLYWPMENTLYVEGSSLDRFAEGKLELQPFYGKGGQRIGLLLDKGIEEDLRIRHVHVADAARATLGINVHHCVITSRPVGVELRLSNSSGASWGCVGDTDTLVEGARALVEKHGCTAVAVVVRFPEDDDDDIEDETSQADNKLMDEKANGGKSAAELFADYRSGNGVDAIAGAEALISHVIGKTLSVPCAHAPAFSPMVADPTVSPKACAEELGYTFLPCVLSYLHRAPHLLLPMLSLSDSSSSSSSSSADLGVGCRGSGSDSLIRADDVDAVVVPYNAMGGAAVLAMLARGKLVVAVADNETSMRVSPKELSLAWTGSGASNNNNINTCTGTAAAGTITHAATGSTYSTYENVHVVRSYAEAAGVIAAHKAGILLDALTPNVESIRITEL